MPLDTGQVGEFERFDRAVRLRALSGRDAPRLDHELPLGEALRAVRCAAGLSVARIARETCLSPSQIEAIERFDLDALPSRPFTIGYVRAYANALGVDEADALRRLRVEAPEVDTALRPPGGVSRETPRRFGWLTAWAAFALLAIGLWNVSRHAATDHRHAARSVAAPGKALPRAQPAGPAQLGAPLPAPPEAATPEVYETPGLAAATAAKAGMAPPAPPAMNPAPQLATVGAPFVPAGAIYGSAAPASGVVFQAKSATALVVRGAGGAVYFARLLSAGEAWRAPVLPGLVVDAAKPAAVEVFVGGVSRGALVEAQTPVSRFAP